MYCIISACVSGGTQKWEESGLSTPTTGFQRVWSQIFSCGSQPTDRRSFEAVDSALSTTVEKKTPKSFTWTKESGFFFKNSVLNISDSSRVKLLLLSRIINISSCFEMWLTWKNEARHQIMDKSCGRSVSTQGALTMEWWLRADCLQLQLHSYGWNTQTQQPHLSKLRFSQAGSSRAEGPWLRKPGHI